MRRSKGFGVLGSFRVLLGGRDWFYLLSLLAPFVVFILALKTVNVASMPGVSGFSPAVDLMRSDAFFALGYVLLWVGLFAATRGGGLARRVVVFLFHAATMLVVLVITCAHRYYGETGTTLDYGTVVLFLPSPGEVLPFLRGVPVLYWVLLFCALFYAALGPRFMTRAVERLGSPGGPSAAAPRASLAGSLGLFFMASAFGFLSLLIGLSPVSASISVARNPLVNLVMTGVDTSSAEEDAGPPVEHPAANATLAQTPQTQKSNVVLVHLESSRAQSVTPYNPELETTPFLDELAENSLVAERAYAAVPHSSKASVAANCGIYPHLIPPTTEALPDGIPAPCLAELLKEEGYGTALFQSSTKSFENFQGLVSNFGYDEYYPLEAMDEEGFEKTNYFGYEDDIMLEPSETWLRENGHEPFVAEYLTGSGHHDYQCLGTSHGQEHFAESKPLNSYLNCMRLQDAFVKNLMDQYKELGLYEETVFVIFGDHGEGFGEHGLSGHNDTIYEEGLKIPLIIHAPGWFGGGEQVEGLSGQIDILPTVLEMLGYEVQNDEYPGYSLLREPPEDRTLYSSCWFEGKCLASIEGYEKYVYHYDNRLDELFDLSEDPSESENLAGELGDEEMNGRRQDLLEWRSSINSAYPHDNLAD
jgi:lipoteichoic acid synthase